MTGAKLIFILQCLFAVAWGVLLIRKFGAVRRVWTGRGRGDDTPRAVIWFLASAMEMGALRWLFFPPLVNAMSPVEIFWWAGVYVLMIVAAGALSWVYWERANG
ncbi:MAG: hypothetical protein V4527_18370 [Pseudomonadota bacterium]